MTAEIAILNRAAVALAADSAVTISGPIGADGRGIQKIYANANKLFELVKGRPVGVMIYDGADLVQVPWETIVKMYRASRGDQHFDCLEDYASDLREYLNSKVVTSLSSTLRSSYVQFCVRFIAREIIDDCIQRIDKKVAATSGLRINDTLRKEILDEVLKEIEESIAPDKIQEWADDLDETTLARQYDAETSAAIPEKLQRMRLTRGFRDRIRSVALGLMLRRSITPSTTGLVIAGFGDQEIFPSLVHVQIGGIIADRVVWDNVETSAIDEDAQAGIFPFAQVGEAATFLTGIDPEVKGNIEQFWLSWLEKLGTAASQIIAADLSTLPPADLDALKKKFSKYGSASWKRFAQYMNNLHRRVRWGPIETSAAFLSKGELADLAETIINLASLRNRVSIDRDETVGGAIDVAVISPGDGFVWIKRKHYFDLSVNPTWVHRQAMHQVPWKGKCPDTGGAE